MKQELQSENAQFGSKSLIFRPMGPRNLMDGLAKTIGLLFYATSSFVHHSFCRHLWIRTRFTVLETLNLGQNHRFLSRVTLQFNIWPWKTIGRLIYTTSSFVYHYVTICKLKLELRSGNTQIGENLFWALWPSHLTLTFCMDIAFVDGNNWKFYDDTMTAT